MLNDSPNTGIFNQRSEDHKEANKEVDVDGLHVRDFGQGSVHRVDQGGHRQHCGHTKAHLVGCSSLKPFFCETGARMLMIVVN